MNNYAKRISIASHVISWEIKEQRIFFLDKRNESFFLKGFQQKVDVICRRGGVTGGVTVIRSSSGVHGKIGETSGKAQCSVIGLNTDRSLAFYISICGIFIQHY